jgi:hypothetical protein
VPRAPARADRAWGDGVCPAAVLGHRLRGERVFAPPAERDGNGESHDGNDCRLNCGDPVPRTRVTHIPTPVKTSQYTENLGAPLMRTSKISLPRAVFYSTGIGLSVLAVACSTGKPRPASIKSEYAAPDTSGRTIYLTAAKDEQREVDSRSYTLGQRTIASVGEPLVEVRNYTVGDRAVRAVLLQDVRQTCGRRTLRSGSSRSGSRSDEAAAGSESAACKSAPLSYLDLPAGRVLNVAGGFEENGVVYYLLAQETPDGTLFLATDRAGRLKSRGYAAWRDAKSETVVTQLGMPLRVLDISEPLSFASPIVRYETEEVVITDSPKYVHFELDYAGTTYDYRGEIWHLLYKEYRRNPPGSPIYTKRLDYTDVGSPIELLGMRIQIHEATGRYLTFTVIDD